MSDEIVARYRSGSISAAVALMELLTENEDVDKVEHVLRSVGVTELVTLFEDNRAGCTRIVAMIRSGMDRPDSPASVEDGIAATRRLFDWSVKQSEESSVALYSLGSAELLATATAEIVAWMEASGLLGRERRALQVGCGIGRMEAALAPYLGEAVGIDVSEAMIEVARRRCVGIANVRLELCSGRDLSMFDDARFDLVYAVDSFPYLVQAGAALVRTHFIEAHRVLAHGGSFVILNYSYRGTNEDRADVAALAAAHGFHLKLGGVCPFSLWSGAAFVMQRS